MLLTITLAAASLGAPVGPSALPTTAPVYRAEADKKADDIGEAVRIVTGDKVTLAGSFFAPRTRDKAKAPGVLLVHDAGSNRLGLMDMAVYLQRKGFGVLAVDLRGHGDSATDDLNWDKLDESAKGSTWAFTGRDIEAASSYLLKRSEVHSSNLSIVGVGAGSSLALRHAIDDGASRAVVLVAPPAKAFGFEVAEGVTDLEGLPCLVIAPKEGRKQAEAMQAECHEANDGYEYVTVQVMKTAAEELLEDKRLNSSFSKWLADTVVKRDK